jgi:hypothetical protein
MKSIILWQGDKEEDKAISSVEIVRRDNAKASLHFASGNLGPVEEEEEESRFEDSPWKSSV